MEKNFQELKIHSKNEIIRLFKNNVLGEKYNSGESTHCGSEGHWLENKMLIQHNNKNSPDILGYEMKSKTTSRITFGDWSPDIDENGNNLKEKWWNDDDLKTKFMEKYGLFNDKKIDYLGFVK